MQVVGMAEFDVTVQLSTVECKAVAKAISSWADGLPNVQEEERALVQSCGAVLGVCCLAMEEKAKNA